MMTIYLTLIIVFLLLSFLCCKIYYQKKELKSIKTKTNQLYHDINSSLVILKLTLENLDDISAKEKERQNYFTTPSNLISLVEVFSEGVGELEKSFRHWNV